MKITRLELAGHLRLSVSKIREIEIDIDDDTQLIIGSNGSGKSSLLKELLPNAPIRSSFSVDGSKTIELIHCNINYKLTYNPSDGHCFLRDGVELNKNGSHDIQKELIAEYFCITGEIPKILNCSLPICDMTPSQRKSSLMELNPVDIGFFIDRYKKVHKDVVAYNNNIDMLIKRKERLLAQKLPDSQYESLIKVRNVLENQEKLLLIWTTTVNNLMGKSENINNKPSYKIIHESIRHIAASIGDFSNIIRSSYTTTLTNYQSRSETINEEIKSIDDQIYETIRVVNQYETKRVELATDSGILEKDLVDLKKQISGYSFDDNFLPIPEEHIKIANQVCNEVNDHFIKFTYIEFDDIIKKEDLYSLRETLNSDEYLIRQHSVEIQSIDSRISAINQAISKYIIPDECNTDKCELYQAYISQIDSKKKELEKISVRRDELSKAIDELRESVNTIKTKITTQSSIWKILDDIMVEISKCKYLNHMFNLQYIIDKVKISPIDIVNEMQAYATKSEQYYIYIATVNKVDMLSKQLSTVETTNRLSADIIDAELTKYKDILHSLRSKKDNLIKSLSTMTNNYTHILKFDDTKKEATSLLSTIESITKDAEESANIEYLNTLYGILCQLIISIRNELTEVSRIANEQEMLLSRLNDEIIVELDRIKDKYDKAKIIEKALFDLPIAYTRNFVNNLIITTNYFINQMAVYQMDLIPIEDGDDLDFSLPIQIEHVKLKDISSCSDGQKAIIKLAFNLALLIELKFNDYPIYVDEVDRALDTTHSTRLTKLLGSLIRTGIVSQMFIVNHHQSIFDGITGSIIVLNGDNIVLPEKYNEHVRITYDQ